MNKQECDLGTAIGVLRFYDIFNPRDWVMSQQVAEKPDPNVWAGEMFGLPGMYNPFNERACDILNECGLTVSDDETLLEGAGMGELAELIDLKRAGIYMAEKSEDWLTFLVLSKTGSFRGLFVDGDTAEMRPNSVLMPFALQVSWAQNPNRERAYKARKYLCDALERILQREGAW